MLVKRGGKGIKTNMGSLANITGQFSKAADGNSSISETSLFAVNKKTFDQILSPIHQILLDEPAYNGWEIELKAQFKELRQICHEVQARHQTDDFVLKSARNRLLNTLQSISESVETSRNDFVFVDSNDLSSLSNFTDIIRGNAEIYKEYMGISLVASALKAVADNIDSAQLRAWNPENHNIYFSNTDEDSTTVHNQQVGV